MSEILVIETIEAGAVTATEAQVISTERTEFHVVAAGQQGPQGAQGPVGPVGGSSLSYLAGAALGGHRMVVLNSSQQAVYADNTNLAHANKVLGMTTGAVSMGDTASILYGGELVEPSWVWGLDQPVYVGTNGLLTQTPPVAGFSQIVGFPIAANKLFVSLREPLILN